MTDTRQSIEHLVNISAEIPCRGELRTDCPSPATHRATHAEPRCSLLVCTRHAVICAQLIVDKKEAGLEDRVMCHVCGNASPLDTFEVLPL